MTRAQSSPRDPRVPWRVAAVLIVALVAAAVGCARILGHRQDIIIDDERRSARLVTYAVLPGQSLRVPVEPGTDVIRVVVQAFSRGTLSSDDHPMRWRVGENSVLQILVPGSQRRAKAEDPALLVTDPIAFNVSTSDPVPELRLHLTSVAGADGALVRVYRREALAASEARLRRHELGSAKREHLAARAGELGWTDLPLADRRSLTGARWKKVAPLPSEDQPLHAIVVQLRLPDENEAAPAPPAKVDARDGPSIVYYRLTSDRPALVRTGETSLVLRVRARVPLPKAAESVSLRLSASISRASTTNTSELEARLSSQSQDVYEPATLDDVVPSELATFYLLIPARAQLSLSSHSPLTDISLAELDPGANGRQFVPRRPSNWADLRLTTRVRAQLPDPDLARVETSKPNRELDRVSRPNSAVVRRHDGLTFIPGSTAVPFDVATGKSETLNVRVLVKIPTTIELGVDGKVPRRRALGPATSLTVPRKIHVEAGETRIPIVIGDDLEPGRHLLSFRSMAGADDLFVHLPWRRPARRPLATAWIRGDFAP